MGWGLGMAKQAERSVLENFRVAINSSFEVVAEKDSPEGFKTMWFNNNVAQKLPLRQKGLAGEELKTGARP